MKTLKLTLLGEDSWHRNVYKDEKGNIYKSYGDALTSTLYTSDRFDGEPCTSIKGDVQITVAQ